MKQLKRMNGTQRRQHLAGCLIPAFAAMTLFGCGTRSVEPNVIVSPSDVRTDADHQDANANPAERTACLDFSLGKKKLITDEAAADFNTFFRAPTFPALPAFEDISSIYVELETRRVPGFGSTF